MNEQSISSLCDLIDENIWLIFCYRNIKLVITHSHTEKNKIFGPKLRLIIPSFTGLKVWQVESK